MKFAPMFIAILLLNGCANMSNKVDYLEQARSCVGLSQCSSVMMHRVRSHAEWICSKKSENKIAEVGISLSKEGLVTKKQLRKSSGDKEMDNAALLAVTESEPFIEITRLNTSEYESAKNILFKFKGKIPEGSN